VNGITSQKGKALFHSFGGGIAAAQKAKTDAVLLWQK
jgi:hypothetical protein